MLELHWEVYFSTASFDPTGSMTLPNCVLLGILLNILLVATAFGHAAGENYVWVNIEDSHLQGRFEMHFNDLEGKLDLDMQVDGETPVETVNRIAPTVHEYILQHFSIRAHDRDIAIEFTDTNVFDGEDSQYAQFFYRTPSFEMPDVLEINNDLLFEDDLIHRSLIAIEYNKKTDEVYGSEFAAMVFSPMNTEQDLDLNNIHGLLSPVDFIWQGVLHIWIGIDHILFLIALLLPAVLVLKDKEWTPVPTFRSALWNILKIVTIFTVAHSITLSLAALGFVQLPSQLVESVIALSIVLVAVNTILFKFREGSWLVIFGFGLFHGLGFASVMGELPFRMLDVVQVMFSFNVGVELGQIAIVAAVFPVIFLLRKQTLYRPVVLVGGSLVICAVACYWFVERAFGLEL